MERGRLEALQSERLVRQVERVYRTSPFYRKKFDEVGVKPEDIKGLEDVARLPFVTKDELRQAQEAEGRFGGLACAEPAAWRELHPSSGTTGRSVYTLWTARDVEAITDFTARLLWSQGVRPGDTIQNAFSYGLWVAGLAVHYAAGRLGCFVVPIGATQSARQVDLFHEWRPTVFFSTPSFALYLVEKLQEQGVSGSELALRIGSFGGEAGAEVAATRRRLEEGLGIDAYDIYGLAEIGPTMAAECQCKDGLHWTEDHHLIEVVDRNTGEPVPEGEEGVIVITHLTREGTPMIRYWTNDIGRLVKEPCRCGRTHARSPGGILGRADDIIIYKGVNFYPSQVEDVVRSIPEISDEFRIRLEVNPYGRDICTLVAEVLQAGSEAAVRQKLAARLREALGVGLEIELVALNSLERTAFKARRVLDMRPKLAS
ncbi:MAG: phenylacetate--CoA ligase [Firmicutes bacterium]|nr:phenylacetate--CoA ligase [Bacillota bacterium]